MQPALTLKQFRESCVQHFPASAGHHIPEQKAEGVFTYQARLSRQERRYHIELEHHIANNFWTGYVYQEGVHLPVAMKLGAHNPEEALSGLKEDFDSRSAA